MSEQSLQERYAPHSACFGCGPSNPKGLRIRSIPHGDEVIADWKPETMHEAFPGMVNGGILGALMDCHSNWTTAYLLMKASGADSPPCTVTAEFAVKLLAPTPSQSVLHLSARPVEIKKDRATIETTLSADGKVTATCRGTFVAVRPGHPAYHRW